ncbi:C-X-C chemokine receptor type 2-like isoform X1 [Pristis pectinata]|uniref:C-X-C chemokine receptor type 2-like isoform X1 n=1 Tax=Pristis pectinata TaxID=685728 RepID=UPI00223D1DE4|nr:C-X-C chemokine receptor type 2-like isoform X1 [Pristis pectinata]XP_051870601.1 C-X-C chemokine receptor type 2-like isoform X1 [Pristis pectinata]
MTARTINLDDINFDDLLENISLPDYYSPGSNVSPCQQLVISYSVSVVLAVVYSLVCFLAVMGNLVVMTVILYNRNTTSTTDVYLLNLAMADLLFALSLPFWAVDATSGWVFGDAMCKVVSILQEVNFYSGILLLACISVDRYLAIVHSAQSHNQKRSFLTKLVCGVVWVMAVLLSLPVLYKGEFIYSNRILCYEILDAESAATWRISTRFLRHIIGFLIPLGVMVFCYSVTIHRLCQTKGFQKQKAMKVVIAVVLAFLVCWLPHNVTVFTDTLLRSKLIADSCARRHHIDRALSATQCWAFLHSCINPILYAFIGVKFRRNLLKLLADKGLVKEREESQFRRSVQSSVNGTTSTTI